MFAQSRPLHFYNKRRRLCLSEYIAGKTKDLSFSDISFLPVIPDPEKIMCIGLNYLEHKKETGRPDVDNPTIFTRFADSQVAHLQPMIKPDNSDRFDYEAEMAIIGCILWDNRNYEKIADFFIDFTQLRYVQVSSYIEEENKQ